MSGRLTYYQDQGHEWRWTLRAENENIVADSAEGYERLAGAVNGFNAVCRLVNGNPASVEVEIQE